MRPISILVAGTLLAGCASAPPPIPESFQLAGLDARTPPASFVDKRGSNDAAARFREAGGMYHFLRDSQIQPPVIEIVASRVAASLLPELRGALIEIQFLRVGFWDTQVTSAMAGVPPYYPAGVPIGAAIVGALVSQGIVESFKPTSSSVLAVANFEVTVAGQRIQSIDYVPVSARVPAAQALERAVSNGLAKLSEQASALALPNAPANRKEGS